MKPERTGEYKVLTKDMFFLPGADVHIQMSNDLGGYEGTTHIHRFIEIEYIVSGEATHIINGKTFRAKRGDLYMINVDTPHVFHPKNSDSDQLVVYDLMFMPAFFDRSAAGEAPPESLSQSFVSYPLFREKADHAPCYRASGTLIGELFSKIYLEYQRKEKGYLEIIRSYLLQLIIMILRRDDPTVKDGTSPKNSRIVDYIVDYIKKHYDTNLTISKLANEVFPNPDYLGRIFKAATGMTVSGMIQSVRIERVCDRLSATDDNVSDIAAACGFNDVPFFYRVFRKNIGVSPSEYRKAVRGNVPKTTGE